jgi:hypothetical protein
MSIDEELNYDNKIPNAPKSYELLLSHNLLLKATTHVTPACCLDFDQTRKPPTTTLNPRQAKVCVCVIFVWRIFFLKT